MSKPFEASSGPDYTTGYDANAPRLNDERRSAAFGKNQLNGLLDDGDLYVRFFCFQAKIDLSLAGNTGQGRYVRDFYPHNIVIPSFEIAGQCLDQQDYGNLVEFVRQAQRKGVEIGQLTKLIVHSGGSPKVRSKMRGIHKPIIAEGYVKSMPRQYKQFEYAPIFKFQFVVATMLEGSIYAEIQQENVAEKSWHQIMETFRNTDPKPGPAHKNASPVTPPAQPKSTQFEEEVFGKGGKDAFGPTLGGLE